MGWITKENKKDNPKQNTGQMCIRDRLKGDGDIRHYCRLAGSCFAGNARGDIHGNHFGRVGIDAADNLPIEAAGRAGKAGSQKAVHNDGGISGKEAVQCIWSEQGDAAGMGKIAHVGVGIRREGQAGRPDGDIVSVSQENAGRGPGVSAIVAASSDQKYTAGRKERGDLMKDGRSRLFHEQKARNLSLIHI